MTNSDFDRKRIGIFAYDGSPLEHMPPRRTRVLLAEAALQGAELLFFSAADCDPEADLIRAESWSDQGWEKGRAGLPRVIHAVTHPVTDDHLAVDGWLRANTQVICPRGLNKLDQVRLFERSSLAAHAIPTMLLTEERLKAELTEWLSTHGGGVVKPIDGSRGASVYFAVPDGERWTFTTRTKPPLDGSFAGVVDALCAAVSGRARYRQFIAQRYIESKERDMALALRIDVHKRPDESWAPTRTAARLNVAGGLATNVAGGGAEVLLDKFLARRSPGRDKQIFAAAVNLACRAAELLDRQPDASLIEIGVDLVIDANDHLWIVETNFHPDANWTELDRATHIVAYLLSRHPSSTPASSQ